MDEVINGIDILVRGQADQAMDVVNIKISVSRARSHHRFGQWSFGREEGHSPAVKQICYRAADLAFLLGREETPLSRYSRQLHSEGDAEEDSFDEEDF